MEKVLGSQRLKPARVPSSHRALVSSHSPGCRGQPAQPRRVHGRDQRRERAEARPRLAGAAPPHWSPPSGRERGSLRPPGGISARPAPSQRPRWRPSEAREVVCKWRLTNTSGVLFPDVCLCERASCGLDEVLMWPVSTFRPVCHSPSLCFTTLSGSQYPR